MDNGVDLAEPLELADLPPRAGDRTRPLDILLICDDRHPANVVKDHIDAFLRHSLHRFRTYNPMRQWTGLIDVVEDFDAVMIHYSILAIREEFLPPRVAEMIRRFQGLKLQFIQDEYRWINQICDRVAELGIHVLFSALRPQNIRKVYGCRDLAAIMKFGTLSGYVPDNLLRLSPPPIRERPLHITYRARELPYWLGHFGRQKHMLAEKFPSIAARHGLRYDLSGRETERIYGNDWISFLCSGKAMLGTEGGSSIFDFDGEAERRTNDYLKRHPAATYEMVHRDVLALLEGRIVHRALTPRIFEAAALKCALVLTRGEYAGVLEAGRHYIPLEPDLSNADEVAELLKDDDYLQEMADRTYDEIVASGRYSMRRFISGVDTAIAIAAERFAESSWTGSHPAPARVQVRRRSRLATWATLQWKRLLYLSSKAGRQRSWHAFRHWFAGTPAYLPYSRLKASWKRASRP